MKTLPSGLPVSTDSEAAVEAFAAGLQAARDGTDGVQTAMLAAHAADPEFSLAALGVAESCGQPLPDDGRARLSDWERSHLSLARRGRHAPSESWGRDALDHLERWPQDTWMFGKVHAWAFFRGSAALRRRLGDAALIFARMMDEDYYRARASMAMTEAGDPASGLAVLEGVLERRPGALSAWHCRVHALHGLSRHLEAEEVCARVEGMAGKFQDHMAWHRALGRLARGDAPGAVTLFDQQVRPEVNRGPASIAVADVAGFAWAFALSTGEMLELAAGSFRRFGAAPQIGHDGLQLTLARSAAGEPPPDALGDEGLARLGAALAERDWPAVTRCAHDVARTAGPELGGSRLQRAVLALVAAVAELQQGRGVRTATRFLPEAKHHPVIECGGPP